VVDDGGHVLGIEAARRLAAIAVADIAPGLTDGEFERIETTFGFEFADDHRAFLGAGLPLGDTWPDWRDDSDKKLRERLGWPAQGVLFDVEWSEFWYPAWGPRPAAMKHALRSARWQLDRVPQMVPVYSHRYLPAGRRTFGHPVLSIYQTDIICYGTDLAHYLDREFAHAESRAATPTVEFWSDLVS